LSEVERRDRIDDAAVVRGAEGLLKNTQLRKNPKFHLIPPSPAACLREGKGERKGE